MIAGFVALSREAMNELATLIHLNRASQRCFRAAGDGVDDAELTALFYRLARQRAAFAEQLGAHAEAEPAAAGDEPAERDPALQRWWQALRRRFSGDEVGYALRLVERAEAEVLAAYEAALAGAAPSTVAPLLREQRDEVAAAHEQIRALHRLWSLRRAG